MNPFLFVLSCFFGWVAGKYWYRNLAFAIANLILMTICIVLNLAEIWGANA